MPTYIATGNGKYSLMPPLQGSGGDRYTRIDPDSDPPPIVPPGQNTGSEWEFSEAEKERLRQRLNNTGIYRYYSLGDVQANSPGDGQRVNTNAATFLRESIANPDYCLWVGVSGTKPYTNSSNRFDIPTTKTRLMMDAMLLWHLYGSTFKAHKDFAKAVLLKLTEQNVRPDLCPTRTGGWSLGVTGELSNGTWSSQDSNNMFQLAAFIGVYFTCFTRIGRAEFSAAQLLQIDIWFKTWSAFLMQSVFRVHRSIFSNLSTTNTTTGITTIKTNVEELVLSAAPNEQYYSHRNNDANRTLGHLQRQANRLQNNRLYNTCTESFRIACYYGMQDQIAAGKIMYKMNIAFGWYADGINTEYYRSNVGEPAGGGKGPGYTGESLYRLSQTARIAWRIGDKELAFYETNYGIFGSSGGPASKAEPHLGTVTKSLPWAWKQFNRLQKRKPDNSGWDYHLWANDYATGTDERYRLSLISPTFSGMFDSSQAIANRMYNDAELRAGYTRTGSGYVGYPANGGNWGSYSPWTGPRGSSSGILLLDGYMEDIPLQDSGWVTPV